jgi:hypothetical protein
MHQRIFLRPKWKKKNELKDVDANQWLVTCRFGRTLRLLWPEAELAVGCILTPRDGHDPPFLFIGRQGKMRDSATASLFYLTPHDILHKSESRIRLTSRAFRPSMTRNMALPGVLTITGVFPL